MTAQGTKKNLSKKILLTLFIASTVVPSIASAHPVGDLGEICGRPLKIDPNNINIKDRQCQRLAPCVCQSKCVI